LNLTLIQSSVLLRIIAHFLHLHRNRLKGKCLTKTKNSALKTMILHKASSAV
jgi:hypothetical protein